MGSDKVTLQRAYEMRDIAASILGHVIWHVICEGHDKQVKHIKE